MVIGGMYPLPFLLSFSRLLYNITSAHVAAVLPPYPSPSSPHIVIRYLAREILSFDTLPTPTSPLPSLSASSSASVQRQQQQQGQQGQQMQQGELGGQPQPQPQPRKCDVFSLGASLYELVWG